MQDRALLVGGSIAAVLGVLLMWVAPGVDQGWMERHHASMADWTGFDDHDEAPAALIDGAVEIVLTAREFGFVPDRIALTAESPVNLVLANEGRVFHDLVVEGTGFHLGAPPGARVGGGLEGLAPGEYRITCTAPGHAAAGMRATLTVTG